ncbi:flagellar hook-basal body protein [Pradoshia sp. D12]|uniref:flagellar hook-basal body protein n=1 Tax=Bacillaceae TaxID=186817 RepID=UPI00112997B8|nr:MULTISPECIES: flagellar hook-basal body protein [Bacillaceae]QFK72966.1 flagellar hook-basal body protein [Pradoshia sp. D12]TPF71958.1 flagellar hook-basal body protein [Bacillus sp. D12]
MFKGFYTAASGMLAQQRKTELLANNLANANTVGYKEDQASVRSFPEMLLSSYEKVNLPVEESVSINHSKYVGALNTGVYVQETIPSFSQGDVKTTDNTTDMAIVDQAMPIDPERNQPGTALFTVETPDGLRYTRNGNFTLDGSGYLTTANGYYVLDENRERILLNSENFAISSQGEISEGTLNRGRIGISFSATPTAQLIKEGDGLYRINEGELPSAYTLNNVQFAVQQGSIEQSNVDSSKTMTDMMAAYRTFEANQKIVQAYDQSMQKTVNEIGKL